LDQNESTLTRHQQKHTKTRQQGNVKSQILSTFHPYLYFFLIRPI